MYSSLNICFIDYNKGISDIRTGRFHAFQDIFMSNQVCGCQGGYIPDWVSIVHKSESVWYDICNIFFFKGERWVMREILGYILISCFIKVR